MIYYYNTYLYIIYYSYNYMYTYIHTHILQSVTSSIKEATGAVLKLHLKNSQTHLSEAISEDQPFKLRFKG